MRSPMSRTLTFSLAFFLAAGPGAVFAAETNQPAPPTLETIMAAWKARQERVRSARFAWDEQQTIGKGYLTDLMPGRMRQQAGIAPDAKIPPQDTTLSVGVELVFDGDSIRYNLKDWQWSYKEGRYVPFAYLSVYNGADAKTFMPHGQNGSSPPFGIVDRVNRHADACSTYLAPIITAFRGMTAGVTPYDIRDFKLSGLRALVDGRHCLELLRVVGSNTEHMWVDPSRDYIVVRYLDTENERPRLRIDVRYSRDEAQGWVPQGWDLVSVNPASGRLSIARKAVVRSAQLNVPCEVAEFDVVFPPGTRVSDQKHKKEYIIHPETGEVRPIQPREMRATYEQLINSKPGEAFGPPPAGRSWLTWALVASGIAVSAGGLLAWRRWRSS